MLVLMAMWVRETCDFPDDDRRLAAVSRVTASTWKSRIGPIVREFLAAENGVLISRRLRKEAVFVERHCRSQSDRKSGQKSSNPLEKNNLPASTDVTAVTTADVSADQPTQQPNNPTISIPDGMDGNAVDERSVIWSKCKDWLVSKGVSDRQARSVIGKWLKENSASEVLTAFSDAYRTESGDPIPYITAILRQPLQLTTAEIMAKATEVNANR